MFVVYVLYFHSADRLYIGQTSNLIARFKSHNELGTTGFTTKYRPWMVIHVEFFEVKSNALAREKSLKSGKGREFIRKEVLIQYL